MRWNGAAPLKPGETRCVTKFLICPRCIEHQWRWLEHAKIEQVFDWNGAYFRWRDEKWVDEKEAKDE